MQAPTVDSARKAAGVAAAPPSPTVDAEIHKMLASDEILTRYLPERWRRYNDTYDAAVECDLPVMIDAYRGQVVA